VVFLGPRANAELVLKFHVALHASHAALPVVTFQPIYVETSVRNKCRCSFYCALLTLHVSTDPLTYTVTAFEFFVLQTAWRWPPIGAETCSVRSAQ
jgi:hypothetical protein